MSPRVLEAVPNFSEGRDLTVVRAIVEAAVSAGADVFDWSADPDHHRSVVTFAGPPEAVEEAAVACARVALQRIDLRQHRGVHPRVGALDVLPFVPLAGLTPDDARESARRVGARIGMELGVPVYYYGWASEPPGRRLAELRRGGFETLAPGWPPDREPDVLPPGWAHRGAHPSAGVTCVGARPVLLAWNVLIEGIGLGAAAKIAGMLRERGGGFPGLRCLALELPRRGMLQLSMNLEDCTRVAPIEVFRLLEEHVTAAGGAVVETEVIGMMPDELLLGAAADRLRLVAATPERMLSRRLVRHMASPPS
jgi:glutamate formiminotransferase